MTTSTLPSTSRRTSLKKPVAYSAFTASAAFSSVSVSPTLIGQIAEHSTGLGALDTLDADILYLKGFKG